MENINEDIKFHQVLNPEANSISGNELEKIFQEKLYVGKRKILSENNNQRPQMNMTDEVRRKLELKTKKEDKFSIIDNRTNLNNNIIENKFGLKPEDQILEIDLNKDLIHLKSEENILNDTDEELMDVYKTKQYFTNNNKMVTFDDNVLVNNYLKDESLIKKIEDNIEKDYNRLDNFDLATEIDSNEHSDAINYKEKYKKLENEFKKMLHTQKNVLKIKSKLYNFIYNEVRSVESLYLVKIENLEAENANLKNELELKTKELSSCKEYIKNIQKKLSEKILAWKHELENKVRQYIFNAKASMSANKINTSQ